jgi:hypothetical protein
MIARVQHQQKTRTSAQMLQHLQHPKLSSLCDNLPQNLLLLPQNLLPQNLLPQNLLPQNLLPQNLLLLPQSLLLLPHSLLPPSLQNKQSLQMEARRNGKLCNSADMLKGSTTTTFD